MPESEPRRGADVDVLFMIISAGIFAYFGFAASWAHRHTIPTATEPARLLPMVALLMWTLRAGAVVFGACVVLAFVRARWADLLYAVAGAVAAVIFLAVATWELTNPRGYFSGVPPILLILFAILGGYGSLQTLRDFRRPRRGSEGASGASGPTESGG